MSKVSTSRPRCQVCFWLLLTIMLLSYYVQTIENRIFRRLVSVVDGDSYLLEVLRYIHRNSIRAGMVAGLDDFKWSSHHGYLSRAKKWNWIHKDFMLSIFSTDQRQARKAYHSFVQQQEISESQILAPTPESILKLVCDHFKVHEKSFQISGRGSKNMPRDIATYLIRTYRQETLKSIGTR